MFRKIHQLTLSAVLITVGFVSELGVANALPVLPLNTAIEAKATEVVPVQYIPHRRSAMTMTWQFSSHGNRCRTRYGNCRYYHQGYYYETPWWTIPLILGQQIQRQNYGHSHVQWCLSRYRSYNPRTDLWLGSSGRRYRCNSPY
jgi:BA14K-like protein